MSQNGSNKLMPNLDQNTTKQLNLTVLQRMDPFIEEILITAAHVTFYEFNIDSSQWSRKDVEGPLFVVKRNTQPRFQFIVMNRRSTDNMVENVLGDFEYEIQVPYLLYRNASQEVNGIWFYNAHECEEVANLFSRILTAYSKVPSKTKASPTKSEFEELEAVPSMEIMDGPLEPSLTITSNVPDVSEDTSFVNFFSTAMNINPTNVPIAVQPYQSSAAIPLPSRSRNPVPPAIATPIPTPTPYSMLHPEPSHESNVNIRSTNLVTPASFFGPPASSSSRVLPAVSSSNLPTAPPLHPHGNVQRPYGAPLLQPFPPPTPPPSLTPPSSTPAPNFGAPISKEKLRETLLLLIQDNQFIDMVHRALTKAHNL